MKREILSWKEALTLLILAFETSAKAASVALMDEEKLLGESYQNTGLTHSQTLMVMAEDVLKQSGKTVQDVEAVAVAAGPGSFTGVRIGVAAAKGFAWGRDLPLYGISTLEAMARSLGIFEGYVCPVMDARRSQVYNALFDCHCGECTRIREDRAISLKDLGEDLQNLKKPVFLVGDGSVLCYNSLLECGAQLIMPKEHRMHQRAVGVALCAADQIRAGIEGNGASLVPNYLRLSQAERERLAKGQSLT